jgi:hypothetical protein
VKGARRGLIKAGTHVIPAKRMTSRTILKLVAANKDNDKSFSQRDVKGRPEKWRDVTRKKQHREVEVKGVCFGFGCRQSAS